MGNKITTEIFAIATAIVGVAIVAVLVGPNSKTKDTIDQGGKFFAWVLKKAVTPVT